MPIAEKIIAMGITTNSPAAEPSMAIMAIERTTCCSVDGKNMGLSRMIRA